MMHGITFDNQGLRAEDTGSQMLHLRGAAPLLQAMQMIDETGVEPDADFSQPVGE